MQSLPTLWLIECTPQSMYQEHIIKFCILACEYDRREVCLLRTATVYVTEADSLTCRQGSRNGEQVSYNLLLILIVLQYSRISHLWAFVSSGVVPELMGAQWRQTSSSPDLPIQSPVRSADTGSWIVSTVVPLHIFIPHAFIRWLSDCRVQLSVCSQYILLQLLSYCTWPFRSNFTYLFGSILVFLLLTVYLEYTGNVCK